jgi:formate dehydrogenase iron-sulfur subunit
MANFEYVLPPAPTTNVKVAFGEDDLVRRSASNISPPAKQLTPVSKLIDVSKCIGCKACQVACLEWITCARRSDTTTVSTTTRST